MCVSLYVYTCISTYLYALFTCRDFAAAVEEGRKIYANIQKFVCFLLGTNIGEIIYLTIAIAASMPLPLEALQVRRCII